MGAIRACVGYNGDGKTLCAVAQTVLPAWEAGRLVIGNLALRPEAAGYPAHLYRQLTSWRDLRSAHGATIVLDEVLTAANSREYQSMPPEMARLLHQLRKADNELVWTAVTWARADVILREATQDVTVCTGSLPDRFERAHQLAWLPKPVRDDQGAKVRVAAAWGVKRLFRWVTYDARQFDEFTEQVRDKIKPVRRTLHWRPGHVAQWCYETSQQVELMDHLAEASGTCLECGGRKSRKACSCGAGGPGEAGSRHAAADSGRAVPR